MDQALSGRTHETEGHAAQLRQLLLEGVSSRDVATVLGILSDCCAEELNALVIEIDLHRLLSDLEGSILRPSNRKALLGLLTHERIGDLTPSARAAVVLALQKSRTGRESEWMLLELFLGLHGRELTEFKNAIDLGGGHHDLVRLVFHDIDDAVIRSEILRHIGSSASQDGGRSIKILSDIDDTFLANWKDGRYPPKTVYPGVLAFYRELDKGPGDVPDRLGDLTFLSARPDDPVGVIEKVTLRMLADCGVQNACMLGGALRRLFGNSQIAKGKYENFDRYRQLFPEYDFVFVGDSGQGDAAFGAMMLSKHADIVRGVFIHDVVATDADTRGALREKGILFFDTYVGAALEAWRTGLIRSDGLRAVGVHALEALHGIPFETNAQREAVSGWLLRDCRDANAALRSVGVQEIAGV